MKHGSNDAFEVINVLLCLLRRLYSTVQKLCSM